MKGFRTRFEHFVRGAEFEVNPGGKTHPYTIKLGPGASDGEINDLIETWEYNPEWFKTIKVPNAPIEPKEEKWVKETDTQFLED